MQTELFALERAAVIHNERFSLNEFNLHIYRGQRLGIICDTITERRTIIEFFRGNCAVFGIMRFLRKPARRVNHAQFSEYFYVLDNRTTLIENLTIAENIRLFSDGHSFVRSLKIIEETEGLLREFDVRIDIGKKVRDLTPYERIQTALLKAYSEKRKAVVLANLSEILTEQEAHQLEILIQRFESRGMTYVLIDSFDTGFYRMAEQTLVIKDRTSVGCFNSDFLSTSEFYNYMTQSTLSLPDSLSRSCNAFDDSDPEELEPVFEADSICTDKLSNLTISLYRGELLKIYCSDQRSIEGFREIAFGESGILSGTLNIGGKQVTRFRNVRDAMLGGLVWCPESPYSNMLLHDMTVRDNLLMEVSHKLQHMWLTPKYGKSLDQYIDENIGQGLGSQKLRDLRPDILQVIAYSKILLFAPAVAILEKPFTDTDSHIKSVTLSMIEKLQDRGIAVILLTMTPSDLNVRDGDVLYLRNGVPISEDDTYQYLYSD